MLYYDKKQRQQPQRARKQPNTENYIPFAIIECLRFYFRIQKIEYGLS